MKIKIGDVEVITNNRTVWYWNNLRPGDHFIIKIEKHWKMFVCDHVVYHTDNICGYCGTKHPDLIFAKGLSNSLMAGESFKVEVVIIRTKRL